MELKPGYKQTEVGVIPEDWEVKPLGSVLNRSRLGGNYPNQSFETNYPLMKMGNIERGYIDSSKIEYISTGISPYTMDRLRYGDILFNTRNTLDLVGKVAIWRNELPVAYYNSNLMRLEFNQSQVCSNEYANYAFNSTLGISLLRALATGTTSVAAIYTRDLLLLPFVIPPLPEQRAIAAALSDVDALIASLDKLIAKKRNIKQAAMQQLLSGEQRLPGFNEKVRYKQTEVGVIPEDWIIRKLGEHATFRTGPFGSALHKSDYTTDGIPVINPMHIIDGQIAPTVTMTITENAAKQLSDFRLKAGDIIIGRRGDMGRCSVVQESQIGWLCGTGSLIIRCAQDVSPHYLQLILSSPKVISAIEDVSVGSTMVNLNQGVISNLTISFPTFPEQHAIAAAISDMDTEIAALEARHNKTRLLKQGMMQELLTGKTRLI